MSEKEKFKDSDIHFENMPKSKLRERFENFWFYYKIHTVVAIFLAVVLSVCVVQSCSKESEDIIVMYAGPHLYSPSEIQAVKSELCEIIPSDFDGNGQKISGFVTYRIMNEEEIKKLEKELQESDSYSMIDRSYFTTQLQTYNQYMMTGECGVFLLCPDLYEKLITAESQRLQKLSEVFDVLPESALDEFGIKFSETPFYKNSKILSQLPEDTILCISQPYVFGKSSDEKYYNRMVSMFIAMGRD